MAMLPVTNATFDEISKELLQIMDISADDLTFSC